LPEQVRQDVAEMLAKYDEHLAQCQQQIEKQRKESA
jgi:hypothetical protein